MRGEKCSIREGQKAGTTQKDTRTLRLPTPPGKHTGYWRVNFDKLRNQHGAKATHPAALHGQQGFGAAKGAGTPGLRRAGLIFWTIMTGTTMGISSLGRNFYSELCLRKPCLFGHSKITTTYNEVVNYTLHIFNWHNMTICCSE